MKTITVYSPAELKEENPDGFEKALQNFRDSNTEIPWQGEIMDSFKAIFKASDMELKDWSIDGCNPSSSYVRFAFRYGENESISELSGQRALAWLENNLLSSLRLPDDFQKRWHKSEHVRESGLDIPYYRTGKAGEIESCPFTGVCFDEDFIESLVHSIKNGDTLGDAYSNLAFVAGKLFEGEIEQANSEDEFLAQDHLEFTYDGQMI